MKITGKLTIIDGKIVLPLTDEMLAGLGVEVGDEIEITIANRTLILAAVSEATHEATLKAIMEDLFVRRESLYRKLAEGVK